VRYRGDFYGQSGDGAAYPRGISVEGLVETLRGLLPGITELGCHPGYGDGLNSTYRAEREQEVRTLCHPWIRDTVREERLVLRSFHRDLEEMNGVPQEDQPPSA
jgi:predicted glycoside hydrolase/deacetylase ChbG (UPF0249 family)